MDVLFCGVGSIGKRHIKNLKALEDVRIYALKSSRESNKQTDSEMGIHRVNDISEINTLDAAFICNPTAVHVDTAMRIIERFSCPLFIEKPLDSDLAKAEILVKEIKKKGIVCMVGYMMRYNRALKELENIIKRKKLGNVIYYEMNFHTYLPLWHPYEDYRTSYASRKDLGGGVIFTLIHEIDMAYWLFGGVKKVMCSSDHISNLEIDVEDYADIFFQHDNGIRGKIHVDYFSKKISRTIHVIFENGVVEWDFFNDELIMYQGNEKQIIYRNDDKNHINNMYIDMLEDLLFRIKKNKKIEINEDIGLYTLKLAVFAKKSAELGKELVIE